MKAKETDSRMYARIDQRKRSNATLVGNERVFQQHAMRRVDKPLVIAELPHKTITVTPKMFGRLDVDPEYQRGETDIINQIIASLKAGGNVVAPPILSHRVWEPSEKLWIVDGLQRCTALMSLDRTFEAIVYEVQNLDQERALFIISNQRVVVSPNRSIKAHPGPTALLLRTLDAHQHHPCYNRINFVTGDPSKISASIAVRGIVGAASGIVPNGKVMSMLSRSDAAIEKDPMAKLRCSMFMKMLCLAFPKTYVKTLMVEALGLVCFERWREAKVAADVEVPPPSTLNRIAKINVDHVTNGSSAARFRGLVVEEVRKAWRE